MSAYMVDNRHIQYLIDAADRLGRGGFTWYHEGRGFALSTFSDGNASEAGQMLLDENLKSINARYPDMTGVAGSYKHNRVLFSDELDRVQVIKSVHCYQYQACEHAGWGDSEAKSFTDGILSRAIHTLPGYGDAVWGAPESEAIKKARLRKEIA